MWSKFYQPTAFPVHRTFFSARNLWIYWPSAGFLQKHRLWADGEPAVIPDTLFRGWVQPFSRIPLSFPRLIRFLLEHVHLWPVCWLFVCFPRTVDLVFCFFIQFVLRDAECAAVAIFILYSIVHLFRVFIFFFYRPNLFCQPKNPFAETICDWLNFCAVIDCYWLNASLFFERRFPLRFPTTTTNTRNLPNRHNSPVAFRFWFFSFAGNPGEALLPKPDHLDASAVAVFGVKFYCSFPFFLSPAFCCPMIEWSQMYYIF